MCNPVAVIAGAVGAVAGKKKAESEAKQASSQSSSSLNKSEETKQNVISNPLIPDTFQARVRLGDSRSYRPRRVDLTSTTRSTNMNSTRTPNENVFGRLSGFLIGSNASKEPKVVNSLVNPLLGRRR